MDIKYPSITSVGSHGKKHHHRKHNKDRHSSHRHRRKHNKRDDSEKNHYKKFLIFENGKILEYAENVLPRNKKTDLSGKDNFKKDTNLNIKDVDFEDITPENCKVTVNSETLPLCENIPHISKITAAPVTIKVPVVIAECKVTISLQSSLKLQDNILEIKDIGKDVYLNKFKFTPDFENHKYSTGIAFIDGFVKKNIEYISGNSTQKETLRYASVRIPFKCATRIKFKTPPRFKPASSQNKTKTAQNPPEQNFKMTQFLNEKVFCELINSEITETDAIQDSHKITEKVVLLLTIKLLQNQDVEISP